MNKDGILIDFDDSFSLNLIELFSRIEINLKLVNWRDSKTLKSESEFLMKDKSILVLGPGPGHISEYENFFKEYIQVFLDIIHVKKIGICLGHQLFLHHLYGLEIVKSSPAVHGRALKMNDSFIQRYNSYTVLLDGSGRDTWDYSLDSNGELALFRSPEVLTMQFHPESVGTNLQLSHFKDLISSFVYP